MPLRGAPLGHYPFGKIPFLFLPQGIFSTPVLLMLSILNMSLWIPFWYIDPPANTHPDHLKHYMFFTLIKFVATTPSLASIPQKP